MRRTSWFWLRNWPLRSKQIAVILVPVLTALILGYLRISTELAKADEFSRTLTQVDLSATVEQLVHDIQGERDLVVSRVAAGRVDDRSAVASQIDTVNRGITRLRAASDSIANLDQAVRTRYDKVVTGLGTLDAIRQMAEQTLFPASDTQFVYDSVIGSLLQLNGEITRVSDDRAISEQAARIVAIANAKEQLAIQNSILRAAALSGSFGPNQLARLRSAQAELTAELTAFQESADPATLARYTNTVAGAEVDDRLRLQQNALNQGDAGAPITINVQELDAAADATLDKMRQVELASLGDLRTTAERLTTTARTNAMRDALIIGVALVLALVLMIVIARSLLTPLRVLRRAALDIAHRRLPATINRILADPDPLTASANAVDPVPLHTTEEVGQVARAIDTVHDQAVRMATEQALLRDTINAILVNLARRSQTLVQRQLGLIDTLEQDEQDPDQLAHLFELDHLATRMRRYSESLLVLSGTDVPRQTVKPLPASEVVGAAISEVEQYTRIEVASTPDAFVQGRVVSDLVHLLAELLENATRFSPPDKTVAVRMHVSRSRELLIQITDTGVGMKEHDLAEANQRLADPPDFDVAVPRRMGLNVVARLARRHNIAVRLRENQDIESGVVARITVPAALVTLQSESTTSATHPAVAAQHRDHTTTNPASISPAFPSDTPRTDARWTDVPATPQPVPGARSTRTERGGDRSSSGITRNPTDHQGNAGPRDAETAGTVFTNSMAPPAAELSASEVEVTPDLFRTGTGVSADGRVDAPTERLSIYQAVLSQWFNEPTSPGDDTDTHPSGDSPHELLRGDEGTGDIHAGAGSWASPGDAGWHAAQTVLTTSAEATTAAGLPKRIPKSKLMPGSAAARHRGHNEQESHDVDPPAEPPAVDPLRTPLRPAHIARDRMASFQQGLRRGRHALISDHTDLSGPHQSEKP